MMNDRVSQVATAIPQSAPSSGWGQETSRHICRYLTRGYRELSHQPGQRRTQRIPMQLSFRSFSLVAALILFGRWGAATIIQNPPLHSPLEEASPNAESRLAAGEKIPFSAAGVYELELIPGISDSLAFRLLEKKAAVLELAAQLPSGERSRALLIIHGVGDKTARHLIDYLSLEARESRATERFIPLQMPAVIWPPGSDQQSSSGSVQPVQGPHSVEGPVEMDLPSPR